MDTVTAEAGGSVLAARYVARMAIGDILPDSGQAKVVAALAALEQRIAARRLARKSSALGWLFARREDTIPRVRGLYIHGAVGRGKTMLVDLFYESVAVRKRKRRAHFHEFMADVHARIFQVRADMKAGKIKDGDPITLVAAALYEEAWLLCFDEFHVTDIADAMILGRLFEKLFEFGVVIVATSNVAPQDLYKGGLNRALFLPFIDQIQEHMDVLRLDSRTDFRLEKLAGVKMWMVPADDAAEAALDAAWIKLTGGARGEAVDLTVKGRKLHVPRAASGVARFSFTDLCEQPLGASDYLRLAHDYHTIMIDRIPAMDAADRNAAKRFIALIDTLYDNAVKLMASADADPMSLYSATDGTEAMEFQRTVSRLIEMGSESYLALPHGRSDSTASGASTGLVET